MDQTHDTFSDLAAGTPLWFTLATRILPIGICGQFLSAGTALFRDPELWVLHGAMGGVLAVPILALAYGAVFLRRLRGSSWWAGLTLALYLTQVALAAGANPLALSLHPFNAALLLTASLMVLTKVERRCTQPIPSAAQP